METKDVGLAVLCAALESAIDPLFDSIIKEFCEIYHVSDLERDELIKNHSRLSDKYEFAVEVIDEYEARHGS